MANSPNTSADHIAKQKKRKDFSDEMVYGSQNGIVEMHKLFNFKVGDEKLGIILANLLEENKTLNGRVEKAKETILALNTKVENMESEMKKYGII